MRSDEQGSILIEFVGSFLMFVLMIASILNLITVVTVQARMQYAITETAKALSMYGYVLHVTGVEDFLKGVNEGAESVRAEANGMIGEVNDVMSEINGLNVTGVAENAGAVKDRLVGWTDTAKENPSQVLQYIMQYALNEINNAVFGEFVLKPLVKHYLADGVVFDGNQVTVAMTGDEYMKSARIKDDLQFYRFSLPGYTPPAEGEFVGKINGIPADDSTLLDQNGDIKIVLQYEIEYSFLGLRLPWGDANPTLKITQTAMTKMWLGGEGEGYKE